MEDKCPLETDVALLKQEDSFIMREIKEIKNLLDKHMTNEERIMEWVHKSIKDLKNHMWSTYATKDEHKLCKERMERQEAFVSRILWSVAWLIWITIWTAILNLIMK